MAPSRIVGDGNAQASGVELDDVVVARRNGSTKSNAARGRLSDGQPLVVGEERDQRAVAAKSRVRCIGGAKR
jgi:hypothetical protein